MLERGKKNHVQQEEVRCGKRESAPNIGCREVLAEQADQSQKLFAVNSNQAVNYNDKHDFYFLSLSRPSLLQSAFQNEAKLKCYTSYFIHTAEIKPRG